MIAKDKAGGNSLQVPGMENIHSNGNLKRHEATGHPKSVHWSAHDMKVAYIQEAHPSRIVVQTRKWKEKACKLSRFAGFVQRLDTVP